MSGLLISHGVRYYTTYHPTGSETGRSESDHRAGQSRKVSNARRSVSPRSIVKLIDWTVGMRFHLSFCCSGEPKSLHVKPRPPCIA